jgi:hypothetical protein
MNMHVRIWTESVIFWIKQRIEEDGDKWKKQLQRIDGTHIPTGDMIYEVYEEINVEG